ncbi:VCBS domain-containing protein, partial [Synechococcus lacustris]|uniref:VCBS domain-containing protein n=1 Tax=Synechococcus lacustris TaxID=2116544 RepID=UPI0028F439C9
MPVITSTAAARAGTVVTAGHNDDGTTFAGTSSISGTLSASDADTGATRTWSLTGSPSTTYGTIAIAASTGVWTYSLDNSTAATQALAEDESATEMYTARVTDDFGAYTDQTITVTINGTNDKPVISTSTGSPTGTIKEDSYQQQKQLTLSGIYEAGDVLKVTIDGTLISYTVQAKDLTVDGNGGGGTATADQIRTTVATRMVAAINSTAALNSAIKASSSLGEISVTAKNYPFTLTATADDLTAALAGSGPSAITNLSITPNKMEFDVDVVYSSALEGFGGWSSADQIRITSGSNAGDTTQVTDWLSGGNSGDGQWFVKPGSGTTLKIGASVVPNRIDAQNHANSDLGVLFLSGSAALGDRIQGHVVIDLNNPTYNDTGAVFQNYATTPWTFSLGGRVLQKGVYATPSSDKSQAVSVTSTVSNINSISEAIFASDVDAGDTQSWSIVNPTGTYGSLSLNGNGGQWSYTVDNSRTQALAEGEVATETFVAGVADSNGASADQTVTVTVTGTNDAPVATYTTANTATEDGQIISGVLTSTDVDVLGTTASYALVGSAIPGLAINANGNWSFDPSNSAYQSLAVDQTLPIMVTYAVTDNRGASNQQSFTITITGTNDAPTVSVGSQSAPLVEAGGSTNATAGTPTATIGLTKVDADGTASFSISSLTASGGLRTTLQLDGSNDYVQVSNNSALNFSGSTPFTLEAWVNLAGTGDSEQNILNKGSDSNCSFRWGVYTTGRLYIWNGTNYVYAENKINNWNTWTHLAASFDGTTLRMYVNGTEAASGAWSTKSNIDPLTIGRDTLGRLINGKIADVRIWATARTASEITDNKDSTVAADSTGLLANYLFNDANSAINRVTNTTRLNDGTYVHGATSATLTEAISGGGTSNSTGWLSNDDNLTFSREGTYGTATFTVATGEVAYELDNNRAATQALTTGSNVTDSFGSIQVTDGTATGLSTALVFSITGSNDGPWVSGEVLNTSANELGINSDRTTQASVDAVGAAGSLWASGIYDPEGNVMALKVANADERTHTGSYGALTVSADGSYRYVVNNSNAAVNALQEDQSLDDEFSISLLDTVSGLSTSRDLRIRIDGTDDRPRSTGSLLDISVDEAGLSTGSNSEQPAGAAFANLQDPEVNAFSSTVTAARTADGSFAPVPLTSASTNGLILVGNYGNLTIRADGSYTYTLNNSNPAVNALREEQNLDDSFVLALTTTQNGAKDVIEQPLVIRINGGNSDPISGGVISAGPALEAGVVAGSNTAVVSPNLTGSNGALFTKLIDAENDSFSVTGGRHSSQSSNSAAVALGAGLKVELFEGSVLAGLPRSTRTETTINFSDGYDTNNGGDGDTYSIRATGQIQAYTTGTNTFKIGSDDGVRVWVNGTQFVDQWVNRGTTFDTFNVPGLTQGEWYDIKIEFFEGGGGSALILRNANDTLVTALRSVQTNAIPGTYGNLTLDQAGGYSYALNQTAANVQSLQNGTTVNDTFYVTVSDGQGGTVEQQLNLSIGGSNDLPVITPAINNLTYTEAASATSQNISSSGTFNFSDVDHNTASVGFTLKNAAIWSGGTLNSQLKTALEAGFALTGAGSGIASPGSAGWSYSLNNANLDFLAQGQYITLTYTVTVADALDGRAEDDVTIRINGTNDAPVITNDAVVLLGSVVEAGHLDDGALVSGSNTVSGILTSSDLDAGATASWSIVGTPPTTYGSMAINPSSGVWTYTLDNSFGATQSLPEGQSVNQTYTARVTDNNGATVDQTIVISIAGTNDSPVVISGSPDHIGKVSAADSSVGTVLGTLKAIDSDSNSTLAWSIVTTPVAYGTLAIATGVSTGTKTSTSTFSESIDGWSGGKLATSTLWGSFLGPYGQGESISKSFGSQSESVKAISFDWFRNDTWDGEAFKVTINGLQIINQPYSMSNVTAVASGTSNGYSWSITPYEFGNYAVSPGWNDQRFSVSLTPLVPTTAVVLGITTTLNEPTSNESWGIDNFAITTEERYTTGSWTFNLDKSNPVIRALEVGQSITQDYTARVIDEKGAYTDQTVSVEIQGGSHGPVITNDNTALIGAVTEAGNLDDGSVFLGNSSVSGTLSAKVDTGSTQVWATVGTPSTTYGSFAIDASTGVWTFNLDNSKAATQALKEGETVTQSYIARVTDSKGVTADQTITVTINGSNDAPTVSSTSSAQRFSEDFNALDGNKNGEQYLTGEPVQYGASIPGWTKSGTNALHVVGRGGTGTTNDALMFFYDNAALSNPIDANRAGETYLVSFEVAPAVYQISSQATSANDELRILILNSSDAIIKDFSIAPGQFNATSSYRSASFNYTGDGSGSIRIKIASKDPASPQFVGAIDNLTITTPSNVFVGNVVEAGNNDDGSAVSGTPDVSGTLSASDPDAGATRTWSFPGTPSTTYGTISIDASTGIWTYTLDNSKTATQALIKGQTVTETFNARVTDDFGAYVDQTVTVTINGTNDVPVATSSVAASAGTVVEAGNFDNGATFAGTSSISGTLSVTDSDGSATPTWSITGTPSTTYGAIAIDAATGIWTYTLDNSLSATQTLKEGQSVTQTYSARVTDDKGAYVDQTITVTVNGTNDQPTVSAVTPVVLSSVGSSAYSGSHSDGSPGNVYIQETPSGQTGTVTQWKFYKPHSTEGLWVTPVIYEKTIDNTFIVRGIGRSRSASGPAGVFTFDFDLVQGSAVFANANYTYGHIDNNLNNIPNNNSGGSIGTASTGSISERGNGSGTWGFINTQNPITTVGASQSISYHTQRHYSSELILNSGGSGVPGDVGTVVEAGHLDDGTLLAGTASVSGALSSTDIDTGATRSWSLTGPQSTTYGAIAIDASSGVWTYTLDNNAPATQALVEGQSITQTYTALVTDEFGAYADQTVTVTVTGTNDAPVVTTSASAQVGSVREAGHFDNGSIDPGIASISGTLTASDADTGATPSWSLTGPQSTTYGDLVLGANTGIWTYTLNNTLPAVQALKKGQSVTQAYTARVTDDKGATADQTVTVTINGTNDRPSIAYLPGQASAGIVEDGGTIVQKEQITLTGLYEVGDAVSVTINGSTVTYTVNANDLTVNGDGSGGIASSTQARATIAGRLVGAIDSHASTGVVVTATASGSSVILTPDVNGGTFGLAVSTTNRSGTRALISTPNPGNQAFRSRYEFQNWGAFAALRDDGSVVTWGEPSYGGDSSGVSAKLASGIVQVYSSEFAFAALKSDGSLVVWGHSDYGGNSTLVQTELNSNVIQVYSSNAAFAALKGDGSVVTWGQSEAGGDSSAVSGQLQFGVTEIVSTGFTDPNGAAFAALKSDGSVVTWGASDFGGNASSASTDLSSGVTQLFSTGRAFAALKSNGSVVTWPADSSLGGNSSAVTSQLSSGVTNISSTLFGFAALTSNGSVVSWGGDPGFSSVSNELSSGVIQIFANQLAFAALKSNGSVVTWGDPSYGGNSSAVSSNLSSGVITICSGGGSFAALKSNGSVVTWGSYHGGANSSSVSSQLTSGVTQIFSTGGAFAALKDDGSVVTWGDPANGGGYGPNPALASGVTQIFTTSRAFAALKSDGSVVTWGLGSWGGNSSDIDFNGPSNNLKVVGFANPFTDDRLATIPADNTQSVTVTSLTRTVNSVSGTLTSTDFDAAAIHTWSIVEPNGIYGNLSVDGNSGAWIYTLADDRLAVQALANGQVETDVINVRVTDDKGASADQTVTITVTGSNDAPLISVDTALGNSSAASISETNASLTASGSLSVSDVDLNDTVTAARLATVTRGGTTSAISSLTDAELLAMFSVSPADPAMLVNSSSTSGSLGWSFNSGSQAFNQLGSGEQLTLTYTTRVTDSSDATADQDVTLNINGSNDTPTITATDVSGAVTEDATSGSPARLRDSGSIGFSDLDLSDRHTATAAYINAIASSGASVSTALATALQDLANTFTLSGAGVGSLSSANSGTVNWAFNLDNSLSQYLAAGESITATYRIILSDDNGLDNSSATQDVSITLSGVNDAPSIDAGVSAFSGGTEGWSNGSLVSSSQWGSFLGAFAAGQSTSKTFSNIGAIKSISFDWLRLDSWDGESFKIQANGTEIFSHPFTMGTNYTTPLSGSSNGYTWTLTPREYGNAYWGSSGWADQRFTFTLTPPASTDTVTLQLSSTLDQASNDEAWGIDNVTVATASSQAFDAADNFVSGPTPQSPSNTWQYFSGSGSNVTLLSNWQPTGNEIIPNQPQWDANATGGNYPFVQKRSDGSVVIHPSNETSNSAVLVGWTNTSGSTQQVEVSAHLSLIYSQSSGVSYFIQRSLTGNTSRHINLSSGTIGYSNPVQFASSTPIEVLAGEQLFVGVDRNGIYHYDHTLLDFVVTPVGDNLSASLILTETNQALGGTGRLKVVDVDLSNTVTASKVAVVRSGSSTGISALSDAVLLAMFSISPAEPSAVVANDQTTGTLTWTFNSGSQTFDYLATGEQLTLTYTVRVTDSAGATADQPVTVSITGSNDPVSSTGSLLITTANELGSSPAGGGQPGVSATGESGALFANIIDSDSADVFRITNVVLTTPGAGTTSPITLSTSLTHNSSITGQYGTLTLSPNGAYTYAPNNSLAVVNSLTEDQSLDESFTFTVSDGQGTSVVQSLTLTIDGSNDGPISSGSIVSAAPVYRSFEISDTWKRLLVDQSYHPTIPGRNASEFQNEGAFAALRADGSVFTWGNAYYGGDSSSVANQLTTDISQIFSSSLAFAAVRDDGSVVTWGAANYGGDSSAVAANLDGGVTTVASTTGAFAALKADGSVLTWGGSGYGGDSSAVATQIDGSSAAKVVKLFSSTAAFAALRSDGSVVVWGDAGKGGALPTGAVTTALNGSVDVVVIRSSNAAFAALRADGTVITWGDAAFGGNSSSVDFNGSSNTLTVTSLQSSQRAFAAVLSDGSVVTWGSAEFGGNSSAVADQLNGSTDVVSISTTGSAFAALRADGSLITWGHPDRGGVLSASASASLGVAGAPAVTKIVASGSAFAALRADGSIVSWGGSGGDSSTVLSALDGDPTSEAIVDIAATSFAFAALRADGTVVTWGEANRGGNSSAVDFNGASDNLKVTRLASNFYAFSALRSDGSVVVWGDPDHGGSAVPAAIPGRPVISFASALSDEWYRLESPDAWAVEQGINADGSPLAGQAAERIAGSLFVNASDPDGNLTPTGYRVGAGRRDGLGIGSNAAVGSNSTATSGTQINGLYGSLSLGADGSYRYLIDNSNATVNALAAGSRSLVDRFVITLLDQEGLTGEQVLDVQILGSDDGPTSSGEILNTNARESGLTATAAIESGSNASGAAGALFANLYDPEGDAISLKVVNTGTLPGTYGSLALVADGSYSYSLNHSNASVNALAAGESLDDVFTVNVVDQRGFTGSQQLRLRINGSNDRPQISVTTGSSNSSTRTETNAALTASGSFSVTDVDLTNTVSAAVVNVTTSGQTAGLAPSLTSNALLLDGYGDFVEIPDSSALDLVSNFTLEAWINPSGPGSSASGGMLLNKENSYEIARFGDGSIQFALAPAWAWVDTGLNAPLNSWSHVALTHNGSSVTVYLNGGTAAGGNQSTLSTTATALTTTDTTLRIGSRTNGPQDFQGKIADVRIWQTLRSADQIASARFSTPDPTTPGLVANYRFDGSGSTVANAVSGASAAGAGTLNGQASRTAAETISGGGGSNPLTMLNISPAAVISSSQTSGSLNWSFDSGTEAFNNLAAGESLTLAYTVRVTDGTGASADQPITVTITGTNDQPQITTIDVIGAVTEDTSTVLTNTGSISFSDADTTDLSAASVALTTSATSSAEPIPTALASALASAVALSGATTAANNGTVNWSFALDNSLVQYLAAGETVTATYTITISDDSLAANASNTQAVTVTITGTNDQPQITTIDVIGAVTEDTSTVLTNTGSISFSDADTTDL